MKRQQVTAYQSDLFTLAVKDSVCPCVDSEAVSRANTSKALQVEEAGEQERALTLDLMGAVLCHSNITQAYKQVKRNKGVAGIDQMKVDEFATWYHTHGESLLSQLREGTYIPQGVKQVEIPKPNGGKRVYISVKVPHISIEKYTTYKLERNNFVHKE